MRPFRFGLQVSPSVDELDTVGHEAEAAGFDVISVADHVGPGLSPLITLARLAASTGSIRLGTLVLNNDMRNPVQLAWDALTLQQISGGRFELGLGAGHTPQEYAATGIGLDHPTVRKERLAEAVEVINRLFAGEPAASSLGHYPIGDKDAVSDAVLDSIDVDPPPILVGGNGEALLRHAARHASAIGLQGLGRMGPDGHRHSVRWDPALLDAQVELIAEAAGDRLPELNALVQVVSITDDREAGLAAVCERTDKLDPAHAAVTPFLAVGTVDEIAEHFLTVRERWGISYFSVRSMELAPVIERLRMEPAEIG